MTLTEYELERQKRIDENKARMAQLGLSQTIVEIDATAASERVQARQSAASSRRAAARDKALSAAPPGTRLPPRRSGRLSGQVPIHDGAVVDAAIHEPYGSIKVELYTTRHVRALGSYKTEWVLGVDGYDADGNRIYDKVSGLSCHQCRQKTLGLHTCCSRCDSLKGQLCGDCLFARYGENINEVNDNPEWVCPYCRDLCNCSQCRTRLGWAPTGALYPIAHELGYKSVAHYLVLNNLEPAAREEALPLMPPELAEEIKAKMAAEAQKTAGGEEAGLHGNEKEAQENGVEKSAAAAAAAAPVSQDGQKENSHALNTAKSAADSEVIVGEKRKAEEEPVDAAEVKAPKSSHLDDAAPPAVVVA